jgi:hypothetical protein
MKKRCYFIFLLILIKLWLISDQLLWARADFIHDDLLFVRLANHLLQFSWLGPYDNLTLVKGPFYPLWIAFSFLAGVPLLLSQHLLYIAACLVADQALRPIIRPAARLALFALLLFNPATSSFPLTCVLRDALYPGLTLLMTAATIGLFVRRRAPVRSLCSWALMAGLATTAFWLTREEGVWMLPFLIPLWVWTLSATIFADWRDWRKIAIMTLPWLLPVVTVQAVSWVNQAHYGVYAVVEFKTPEFRAAYGALTRVRSQEYKPQIPVPKETRQRIYAQSEAFAELQPFFEQKGFWTLEGLGFGNHPAGDDEIGGGWFSWALRDAAAAAGYFKSGAQAAAFFQRLADEINAACDAQRLDCLEERASLLPRWRHEYLLPVVEQVISGFTLLATFKWLSPLLPDYAASDGAPAHLTLFADLTRERLSAPTLNNQGDVQVRGWAVHTFGALTATLVELETGHTVAPAQFTPSPDIAQHFLAMNPPLPGVNPARFKAQGHCEHPCILRISGEDSVLADVPLKRGPTTWSASPLWVYIDEARVDSLPRQTALSHLKLWWLERTALVYRIALPLLGIIALAALGVWLVRSFRSRKPTVPGLIALGIAMAIGARLLILAIIEVTSSPAMGVVYMSPLYPLLLLGYGLLILEWQPTDLAFIHPGHWLKRLRETAWRSWRPFRRSRPGPATLEASSRDTAPGADHPE